MLSDDSEDLDDFEVPEGLADFLKQADLALTEQTQMFLDEFATSPTPPDQSRDSADGDISHLDDLQANMAQISILDKPAAIDTTIGDKDPHTSPVAQGTSTSMIEEEKKAPHGKSEVEEDSTPAETGLASKPSPSPSTPLKDDATPAASPVDSRKEANGLEEQSQQDTLLFGPELSPAGSLKDVVNVAESDNGSTAEFSPARSTKKTDLAEEENGAVTTQDKLQQVPLAPEPQFAPSPSTPVKEGNCDEPDDGVRASLPGSQGRTSAELSPAGSFQEIASYEKNDEDTHLLSGPELSPAESFQDVNEVENEVVDLSVGKSPQSTGACITATVDDDAPGSPPIATSPGVAAIPHETIDSKMPKEKASVVSEEEPRSLFGAFKSFARSVVPSNIGSQDEVLVTVPTHVTKAPLEEGLAKIASPIGGKGGDLKGLDITNDTPVPMQTIQHSVETLVDSEPELTHLRCPSQPTPTESTYGDGLSRDAAQHQAASATDPFARSQTSPAMRETPQPSSDSMQVDTTMEEGFQFRSSVAVDEMHIDPTKEEAIPHNNPMISDEVSADQPTEVSEDKMQVDESAPGPADLRPSTNQGPLSSHGTLLQSNQRGKDASKRRESNSSNPTAKTTKTAKPLLSPTSRLVQPTAASRTHVASAEKRAAPAARLRLASPAGTASTGKRHSPSRVPVPSTVRITTSVKKLPNTSSTQTKSRFMQPTAAQRAHRGESTASSHAPDAPKRATERNAPSPPIPSRLMKGTAASSAKAPSSSSSTLPQKRNLSNDAVARARERGRLRKLQETKPAFHGGSAKFNIGSKPKESPKKTSREATASRGSKTNSPHFATPTSSTRAHQRTSNVSLAQSAVFFGKGLRGSSSPSSVVSTNHHTLTVPHGPRFNTTARFAKVNQQNQKKGPALSMAQSNDLFSKGLRSSSNSPPSRIPPRQGLTVPVGPKFSSSATSRDGSKRTKVEPTVSLAQSSNLLASSLRGYSSVPTAKRPTGLTRPTAPKFHSIHKRPLPKSSAEIEEENMSKFRARPFRANQKSLQTGANQKTLHTGSSAGLTKVAKRTLTKPEPFKLSSGSASPSRKERPTHESKSGERLQFGALALTSSSSSGAPTRRTDGKRSLTRPEPFSFAVDLKSKPKASARMKGNSNSPKSTFRARPVPKSTFRGPSIPVHTLSTPDKRKRAENE